MIGAGREIGVQVAAYRDGKLVVDTWGGLADPATGRSVDGDTLFNVYSVTKAVAATALHVQAERGLIEYDAPIVKYWPEYGARGKEQTTVRDALTHRACVPQMPDRCHAGNDVRLGRDDARDRATCSRSPSRARRRCTCR